MWNPGDLKTLLILGLYPVVWGYVFIRYGSFDRCTEQMLENSRRFRWIPAWPTDRPTAALFKRMRVIFILLFLVHTAAVVAILWSF